MHSKISKTVVFFRGCSVLLFTIFSCVKHLGYFKKKSEFYSKILLDLGPAFIKFAQFLSTRPDIIGQKLASRLAVVQDNMPFFHRNHVDKVFTKNFSKKPCEIFAEFNYCAVAAASIAQVHKAKMHNGEYCAVKILRPKIKQKIQKNVKLLMVFARFFNNFFKKFKRFRLPEVILAFEQNLLREIDLTFEAANAEHLRKNLEKDDNIYIPKIYWNLTRVEILTMEWINATPINKLRLSANKTLILINLVDTFCNQAYRDGVFHADMHPGNIFVDEDSRIILTDFGVVGRMNRKTKIYITEILRGFLQKDYKLVAKIHKRAGYLDEKWNIEDFENACRAIGEQIVGLNLNDISIGVLLTAILKLANDFEMKTRIELLLIQKSTILLEAVARIVDVNANIWRLSDQWIKKHYMRRDIIIKRKIFEFIDNFHDVLMYYKK